QIKGALDLTGIDKQLSTGESLPITEEEFADHSVQIAIKMGFLTFDKSDLVESDSTSSSMIRVKNVYDRPLRINLLDGEVRPGQTFSLSEDQINSSDIRGALAKGFLEIISSARIKKAEETDLKVGNLFSDEPTEIISSTEEKEKSLHLETNEEVVNPSIIDTETPKPINTNDIDDPKGKTVIWNPNKDPITHTQSQMKSVTADREGETSNLVEATVDVSDISFVDAELDKERRESHPVLKNLADEPNDGIDFL
ncbi:MAG: hypothetical protein ACE5H1_07915, partial [Thermodesulfobacteriota bacterium]